MSHIARASIVLVATLLATASCEHIEVPDLPLEEQPADNRTNVTVRICTVEQMPFNTMTRTASEGVCTRLGYAVFDPDGNRVKLVNQSADDNSFGSATFSLNEGEYTLVAVGHSCQGNATMSSAEEISFPNNKLTDTFYACTELTVGSEENSVEIALKRCVAMMRVVLAPDGVPQDCSSVEMYYTGGSSTLNAKTGYGAKNSRQTEIRDLATSPTTADGCKVIEVYSIPHEENDVVDMRLTAKDASNNNLEIKEWGSIPIVVNHITQYLNFSFTHSASAAATTATATINAVWDGTTTVY